VKKNGFTLLEMLVALIIFGMLTAAGVALLSVTARTQETADRLLGELGEVRRLGALLTADLGQAAPRLHRDGDGRPQRAFMGDDGENAMLMVFVRRGWEAGEGGPAVQRVGYRFAEGQLQRLAFAQVDGGGAAIVSPLLSEVRSARLRYRDDRGDWHATWDASDGIRLPVAVELVTDSRAHGPVRQVFLVGTAR
jgi:general secretion pathway protein J